MNRQNNSQICRKLIHDIYSGKTEIKNFMSYLANLNIENLAKLLAGDYNNNENLGFNSFDISGNIDKTVILWYQTNIPIKHILDEIRSSTFRKAINSEIKRLIDNNNGKSLERILTKLFDSEVFFKTKKELYVSHSSPVESYFNDDLITFFETEIGVCFDPNGSIINKNFNGEIKNNTLLDKGYTIMKLDLMESNNTKAKNLLKLIEGKSESQLTVDEKEAMNDIHRDLK
jgi:hypothetical protein